LSPTLLPTQKSTDHTGCSFEPSHVTVDVTLARIAVLSKVVAPTGVIIVEEGIVTRTFPVGLNTTFVPVPTSTCSAAVVDQEIVDTVPSVPPVTVTAGF
jgi:hypothetical protein